MFKHWIALAAALALAAGAAQAVAATADDAKAAPAAAPAASAAPPASEAPGRPAKTKMPATVSKDLVNLNAATAAQLKALPGGSDKEAAQIIASRPYNSKAELVSKKAVSDARYAMIKKLVVAGEPAKPATAKK